MSRARLATLAELAEVALTNNREGAGAFRLGSTPGPGRAVTRPGPTAVHTCPVHLCDRESGAAAHVERPGQLCDRHMAKISLPLAYQLAQAEKHRRKDLEQIRSEAVKQARRQDQLWSPWVVRVVRAPRPWWGRHNEQWTSRLIPCATDRRTISQCELWDQPTRFSATVINGVSGQVSPAAQARALAPWALEHVTGSTLAIALRRYREESTLSADGCSREHGGIVLPPEWRALAVCLVTKRAITVSEAEALHERAVTE